MLDLVMIGLMAFGVLYAIAVILVETGGMVAERLERRAPRATSPTPGGSDAGE